MESRDSCLRKLQESKSLSCSVLEMHCFVKYLLLWHFFILILQQLLLKFLPKQGTKAVTDTAQK